MSWHWIVSICYAASSVFYCAHLWIHNPKASALGLYAVRAGVVVHTVSIAILYLEGSQMAGGLDKSLYFFSWLIALVFIASQAKYKAPVLGAFAAPLAFLMIVPSLILPQGIIEHDPSLKNPWILVHVVFVFLGDALFTVAFIAGGLYIFQERQIKLKRLGRFLRKLPSLSTLDNINHICLLTGFPLLTIGLALGILLAKEIWGVFWTWEQKETWSLATWFLYAILIHGRLAAGWKGRKVALGAVLGFGLIIFTFFVIGYFAPGRHDFLGRY